jgi:hypothetical protein
MTTTDSSVAIKDLGEVSREISELYFFCAELQDKRTLRPTAAVALLHDINDRLLELYQQGQELVQELEAIAIP